ncbi:hypothetical protein RJ639_001590 [Escallonia herrerae]|uniref:Remorin C-terminal domain-containing protein n=1 Tax=Escallonia herrerae TaxID=1293975 RepID=A0AA88X7H4_9ASTE|nr:hypothetical protein RJ639_001590 [Escallonia herrerae]
MKNKMAKVHKEVEENRAIVETRRGEDTLKIEELAAKFRATRDTPKSVLVKQGLNGPLECSRQVVGFAAMSTTPQTQEATRTSQQPRGAMLKHEVPSFDNVEVRGCDRFTVIEFNCICPGIFKVASMMACGSKFFLAVPVLASIYNGQKEFTSNPQIKKCEAMFPIHYVYRWIGNYFNSYFSSDHIPYGARMTKVFSERMEKSFNISHAQDFLQNVNTSTLAALSLYKQQQFTLTDDINLSSSWSHYFISLCSSYLTIRRGSEYIIEPYNLYMICYQFRFCQDIPGGLKKKLHTSSLDESCTRLSSRSQVVIPSHLATKECLSMKAYAAWWLKQLEDASKPIKIIIRTSKNMASNVPKSNTSKGASTKSSEKEKMSNSVPHLDKVKKNTANSSSDKVEKIERRDWECSNEGLPFNNVELFFKDEHSVDGPSSFVLIAKNLDQTVAKSPQARSGGKGKKLQQVYEATLPISSWEAMPVPVGKKPPSIPQAVLHQSMSPLVLALLHVPQSEQYAIWGCLYSQTVGTLVADNRLDELHNERHECLMQQTTWMSDAMDDLDVRLDRQLGCLTRWIAWMPDMKDDLNTRKADNHLNLDELV